VEISFATYVWRSWNILTIRLLKHFENPHCSSNLFLQTPIIVNSNLRILSRFWHHVQSTYLQLCCFMQLHSQNCSHCWMKTFVVLCSMKNKLRFGETLNEALGEVQIVLVKHSMKWELSWWSLVMSKVCFNNGEVQSCNYMRE